MPNQLTGYQAAALGTQAHTDMEVGFTHADVDTVASQMAIHAEKYKGELVGILKQPCPTWEELVGDTKADQFAGIPFKPKKQTEAQRKQARVTEAVRSVMLDELGISRASITAEIAEFKKKMIAEARAEIEQARKRIISEELKPIIHVEIEKLNVPLIVAEVARSVLHNKFNHVNMKPEIDNLIAGVINREVTRFVAENISVKLGFKAQGEGGRKIIS